MKPFNKIETTTKEESNLTSLVLEKVIYCIMVLIFLAVFSSQAFASSLNLTATSLGHKKVDDTASVKLAQEIKQRSTLSKLDEQNTYVTREEKLASKKKSAKNAFIPVAKSHFYDFALYSASTKLFEDDDGDGYYNTFGVLFDADVLASTPNFQADVYAEIYISQDGGPWVHLYTTDTFSILGDSSDDEYEVINHLTNNYQPGHYNILIDLYEAGYTGIVASISSDDTDQLYALPLESQDYEELYMEYHEEHGGSSSLLALFIIAGIQVFRKQK